MKRKSGWLFGVIPAVLLVFGSVVRGVFGFLWLLELAHISLRYVSAAL